MWLIWALVIGLGAGALARLAVPGRDDMSIGATLILGIVGSFIGGFLGWLLFGRDAGQGALQLSGLLGSFIGAVIALLIWRWSRARRGTTAI